MKTLPRRSLLALVAVLCLGSSSVTRADYPAFMRSMFPAPQAKPVQKTPPLVKKQFQPQQFSGATHGDKLGNFQIQDLMSSYNQNQTLANSVLKKQQETQKQMIKKLK